MNFNSAQFERAFGAFSQLTESDRPEICFSGRSNVGKSSLINKVLGRKSIARVSSKPGKTVNINFFTLENLRLVDLPGYGYAKVADSERIRWAELMEGYFGSGRNIKMVFQLIDMRHTVQEYDLNMLDYLTQMGIPFTVVLTKADKLNKAETERRLSLIKDELGNYYKSTTIIPFSALKGSGVEEIKKIIEAIPQ